MSVYKITSKQTDLCYVGSTTKSLKARFCRHKSVYNKCSSREIMKYPDCSIELIEETPVEQLRERERYWYLTLDCVNTNNPLQTPGELKAYMKEYLKEYKVTYCKINKAKINEQKKKKYECECGGCYTRTNKSTHVKSKMHQAHLNIATE